MDVRAGQEVGSRNNSKKPWLCVPAGKSVKPSFNPERSQKFGFPDWFSLNLIFNPPVNSGFPQNFLDFFSGKPGKLFETKKELPLPMINRSDPTPSSLPDSNSLQGSRSPRATSYHTRPMARKRTATLFLITGCHQKLIILAMGGENGC